MFYLSNIEKKDNLSIVINLTERVCDIFINNLKEDHFDCFSVKICKFK